MREIEDYYSDSTYGSAIPLNRELLVVDWAGFGFPAMTAKFIRDQRQQLYVVAKGVGRFDLDLDAIPGPMPGVAVLISDQLPGRVTVSGLHLDTYLQTDDLQSESRAEARYLVGRVEGLWREMIHCRRSVYWIVNIPGEILWPCSTRQIGSDRPTRSSVAVFPRGKSVKSAADHVSFSVSVSGIERVTVGKGSPDAVSSTKTKFGYLELFKSSDSAIDRQLVHSLIRALELAFGAELGIHGESHYADDGGLCSTSLHSPRFILEQIAMPAILLDNRSRSGLNPAMLSAYVSRYLDLESRYELNRISWLLSFSRSAPIDMRSVYAGVAFEILMRRYFVESGGDSRTRYFDSGDWTNLQNQLRRVSIDDPAVRSKLEERDQSRFSGAIDQLNSRSILSRSLEMLNLLGIDYGEVEEMALRSRNDAAHGNAIADSDHRVWLDRARALEALVIRVVLAILRLDFEYVDWTSEHYEGKPWRVRQTIHPGPRLGWR